MLADERPTPRRSLPRGSLVDLIRSLLRSDSVGLFGCGLRLTLIVSAANCTVASVTATRISAPRKASCRNVETFNSESRLAMTCEDDRADYGTEDRALTARQRARRQSQRQQSLPAPSGCRPMRWRCANRQMNIQPPRPTRRPAQDVDRPQRRADRDAGAAGRFLVTDRHTPGVPTPSSSSRNAISGTIAIQMRGRTGIPGSWSDRSERTSSDASGVIGKPCPYA